MNNQQNPLPSSPPEGVPDSGPLDQPRATTPARKKGVVLVVAGVLAALVIGGVAFLLPHGGVTAIGELTWAVTCPTADVGDIVFILRSPEGTEMGRGLSTLKGNDTSCTMGFSFKAKTADSYTLSIDFIPKTGADLEVDGPKLTQEQLTSPLLLTPADFPVLVGAQVSAQDRQAQSDLRNALVAAKTLYIDASTYAQISPETAAQIEPSLTYDTSATASVGVVSIRDVSATTVLLVTKSDAGTVFCIADNAYSGTTYGTVDAQAVTECPDPLWPE